MDYDIKTLKDKIIAELLLIQTENQPKLETAISDFVNNAEERYTALLEYMADHGEVKFLLDRLKDEKDIFEQEILTVFTIGKGAVQSALNNVQDILLQEVKTVIADVEKNFNEGDE